MVELENQWHVLFNDTVSLQRKMNWTELPKSTHIAYLGHPIVLLNHIDKYNLYF
jgi:hypothetical protein